MLNYFIRTALTAVFCVIVLMAIAPSTAAQMRYSITDLGTLGGRTSSSYAAAINNLGQVVGREIPPSGVTYRAFRWQDGMMHDLNDLIAADSGWILAAALGINDAGQIAGYGTHNGQSRAFLLTPSEGREKPLVYYALGDSVAAGHGLPAGDGQKLDTCRRSPPLAYPYKVKEHLESLLPAEQEVQFFHLACSGALSATAHPPSGFDPIDFPEQVEELLKDSFPPNQITLVSITIGANDFGFVKESFLGKLICEPDYQSQASKIASGIHQEIKAQLLKIIEKENVYVILTDYFNPFNQKSGFFDVMTSGKPVLWWGKPNKDCRKPEKLSHEELHKRTKDIVETLNKAIEDAVDLVGRPDRVAFASIYVDFQEHASAGPNCGGESPPDEFTTWIQYAPGQLPGNAELWFYMRKGNDCFHPNEKGAEEGYGLAVYKAAQQLLPCLDC